MLFKRLAVAACLALGISAAHADPNFWKHEWQNTDFVTSSIDNWVDIMSGGPPKDGIPAVDGPQFIPVSDEEILS